MINLLKTIAFTLALGGISLSAAPYAQAQDNGSNSDTQSSQKTKRVDYKSPPSPELLAQQRGETSSANTAKASEQPPSTRKAKTKKAKKRKAREMPL